MPGGLTNKLAMHQPAIAGATHRRISREFLDRLADLIGVRSRWQGRSKTHEDTVRNAFWPFPQESAAAIAEDASPEMVEANGHDRRRAAFDNLLEAALEWQQEAGARDAPLRKDANGVALGQCFAGVAQRRDDRPRAGGAVNRYHTQQLEDPTHERQPRVRRPDEEAHAPSLRGKYQKGVDPAHMVADEKHRAVLGDVLRAVDRDAIESVP